MDTPAATRPCGFSLLHRPEILGQSSLATAGLHRIARKSMPLAAGHASPIVVLDSGDVPLPARQAGHGLAGSRPPTAVDPLIGSASRRRSWGLALRSFVPARDARGVLRSDIPTCPWATRPPRSIFIKGPARWSRWTCAPKTPNRSCGACQSSRPRFVRAAALWRPSSALGRSGSFTGASGFSRHGQSGDRRLGVAEAETALGFCSCRVSEARRQSAHASRMDLVRLSGCSPMHARTAHRPPAPESPAGSACT